MDRLKQLERCKISSQTHEGGALGHVAPFYPQRGFTRSETEKEENEKMKRRKRKMKEKKKKREKIGISLA